MTCQRLIEVALPIREISAESVREKSLRHGHISTLHLWWARRPLAASRAIVFASLIPDPDSPECPLEFKDLVIRLLRDKVPPVLRGYRRGKVMHQDPDPYKPVGLSDTPRNRLLNFIARWSPEWLNFEQGRTLYEPSPSEMLDDRCLAKWETSNPNNEQGQAILKIASELVKTANGGRSPIVLDPFAGGGSIPLEAGRLDCVSIANDYNPVAYLVLRASCEFPQKFGKIGKRLTEITEFGKTVIRESDVTNTLLFDLEYWTRNILIRANKEIGKYYPTGSDRYPVVGYLWARTVPCANPACKAEIPLLHSLIIGNKPDKQAGLEIHIEKKEIRFRVVLGKEINQFEGTMLNRGDCRCPICRQITPVEDLRRAGIEGKMGERMVAVITDTPRGKSYRSVENIDLEAFQGAKEISQNVLAPTEAILPEITQNKEKNISNSTGIRVHLYGMKTWGSLFNPRQLVAMNTFTNLTEEIISELNTKGEPKEYIQCIAAYLGLWVSRISMFLSNVGVWKTSGEFVSSPFSMQAIPMVWDYPEINPLSDSTGGGLSQLDWMLRFIEHESSSGKGKISALVSQGDSSNLPFNDCLADICVTDPPYFDAIAYADLSDYFYVWLKRSIGDAFPGTFSTPLSPKGEEATALIHRHDGNQEEANSHFTKKITDCLCEAKRVCKNDALFSIMFAHQSTEAWTALINALLKAGLSVTATYPIDTERGSRTVALGTSALASSITVVCRPNNATSIGSFRKIRQEIEGEVKNSVHRFWEYGFRGADLIVACYGPAVGVFGKYEYVEKADGSLVKVSELLDLVRQLALKAIAGEFVGDNLSRIYFVWANLYGISEQAWDDARLVIQVGSEGEDAMEVARKNGIFVVEGPTCRLSLLRDRSDHRHLGEDPNSPLVDQLHRAMLFWKQERRSELVQFLKTNSLSEHEPFWKLTQALFEVLPRSEEDWKLISALLGERGTLKQEVRRAEPPKGPEQLPLI